MSLGETKSTITAAVQRPLLCETELDDWSGARIPGSGSSLAIALEYAWEDIVVQMETINQVVVIAIFGMLSIMLLGPPLLLGVIYFSDRRQKQHAILRNFPILGRLRYLLEHLGPELRQYLFDADLEGKPFTREGYRAIVFAGKYLKTLVSFGSKRDFEQPGWYIRNAMLPTLMEDVGADRDSRIATRSYVIEEEGLFRRRESMTDTAVAPWTLSDEFALTLGAGLESPWAASRRNAATPTSARWVSRPRTSVS